MGTRIWKDHEGSMKIKLRDIQLYCHDEGHGETLMFVHGFPLDHSMWLHQIKAFRKTHRVLAPDLRGFGQSDAVPNASTIVTMAQLADDMAELLDSLNIETPVIFCGLSMGGYVGWEMFSRHRDRLTCLVLCDTRADQDSPKIAKGREIMARQLECEGTEFLVDSMTNRLFSPETIRQATDAYRSTCESIRGCSAWGAAAAARGMAKRRNFSRQLAEIDLPTLIVCGQYDTISTPAEMRSLASEVSGARFCEIPDAGHMAPLENPTVFNQLMGEFLTDMRIKPEN